MHTNAGVSLHGWLNLDKPEGITSTRAVGIVKRHLRPKKIGHGGTLDPLATGMLPLALGDATKTVQFLMNAEKEYVFTVRFGIQTDTDDAEGSPIGESASRPSDEAIRRALPLFTGEIEQLPPAYSALKIDGERAYDLARAGEEVILAPRLVWIGALTLLERPDADHATFHMLCGKGTYVRSLARDLAHVLGTKGHVSALRRTRVGPFDEKSAIPLDFFEKLEQVTESGALPLLPPEIVLDDIPALRVDVEMAAKLRHGQSIFFSLADVEEIPEDAGLCKAMCRNRLVALVERQGRRISPVRVFQS